MSDVVVLGSANLDLVASVPAIPEPGETILATGRTPATGGKGLNQAVAAARGGAPTLFLGAVGDDDAAELLLGEATAAGIDTSLLRRVRGPSGTAWIMVRPDGENAILVHSGANATVTELNEAERRSIGRARVLVAQLETPLSAVTQAARVADEEGVRFVLNAAPGRTLPDDLLGLVDVLVVNEHEARQIAGCADPREAAGVLRDVVGAVVITLGSRGALIADDAGRRDVAGIAAEVVDTTGAGDTFTGVLAATLAAGESLEAAAARAVVAGALAVETPGAISSIPTAARIERRMRQHSEP